MSSFTDLHGGLTSLNFRGFFTKTKQNKNINLQIWALVTPVVTVGTTGVFFVRNQILQQLLYLNSEAFIVSLLPCCLLMWPLFEPAHDVHLTSQLPAAFTQLGKSSFSLCTCSLEQQVGQSKA